MASTLGIVEYACVRWPPAAANGHADPGHGIPAKWLSVIYVLHAAGEIERGNTCFDLDAALRAARDMTPRLYRHVALDMLPDLASVT